MGVLFVCMMCTTCVQCLWTREEDIASSGTGVAHGPKPSGSAASTLNH